MAKEDPAGRELPKTPRAPVNEPSHDAPAKDPTREPPAKEPTRKGPPMEDPSSPRVPEGDPMKEKKTPLQAR